MNTPRKPKVIITGANGQLATVLIQFLQMDFDVVEFDKSQLDISCLEQVQQAIEANKPEYVINCAAYTWVDGAEDNQQACFQVNEVGTLNLAQICVASNAVLIHLSTDYVFDGISEVPYLETDTPNPLNVYGKSKLAGEQAITKQCVRYIIIRTASLFSLDGNNFCRSILKVVRKGTPLTVVDDQFSGPTYVNDLANAILKIIHTIEINNTEFNDWGIYHYCGEPRISWYDFALDVLSSQGFKKGEYQCASTKLVEQNSKAIRPKMSMLNNQKIQSVFAVIPSDWKAVIYKNKFKL